MDVGTAELGAIAGAAGAVLVLTAGRRATLIGGFALLAFAEAALVGSLAVADRLASPTFAALGLAALVVVAATAAVLARRPMFVLPLVLAAAPFRLPLDFGREHRFFVAVAEPGQLGRLLPPFAVLIAVVGRSDVTPGLRRALAIVGVGLGCVFAAIGLAQAATGTLLFYAPNLEVSNSYSTYFRVTSLFRDPSVYGRHVALAIGVVLVAVWVHRVNFWLATGLVALMWAGLYFSYSQSSFVALFVATAWIVVVTGGRRARRLVVGAAAAAVVGAAVLAAAALAGSSAKKVTSDRSRRVELTARVYKAHPVVGVGLGAQPLETQHVAVRKGPVPRFVSHTTPLTVAAELGTIGVLLYGLLLAAAIAAVARVRRRDAAVGIALGATLLALFVHSLFYSGFFEDPITWFALGLAAAYLAAPRAVETAAAE